MSNIIVNPKVKEKHPDLVELILGSKSMDNNEKKYWFNMLLIMTDEQVNNLRDILVREKKRLIQIEQTKNEATKLVQDSKIDEAKIVMRQQKVASIKEAEENIEQVEKEEENAVLEEIANL